MPKRKITPCSTLPTLSSLDAALDLLACETFTRLESLSQKFESAIGVELNEGVIKARWEEAVNRYWVMKSMDDLCCGNKVRKEKFKANETVDTEPSGRLLPPTTYPGAVASYQLDRDEEAEWRRWKPLVGNLVMVDLPDKGKWPGKIIDKRVFFQGRTVPRGNHFFAVRIYSEDLSPVVTIKARLVPFSVRPTPPLLASSLLLSAYNHAVNPATFDMKASARESLDAYNRSHPGVGDEDVKIRIKAEKAAWNEVVNRVMDERRVEKLMMVEEERAKRLSEVTHVEEVEDVSKKRKTESEDRGGIFKVPWLSGRDSPLESRRPPSPLSGLRLTPQRPLSPRRFDKRRASTYTGVGESSPRGRTYTPPRILPSGDECNPSNISPVPSLHTFDFVSPLGPVKLGRLVLTRKASLEVVREEVAEEGWTVVEKRGRRAGSAPCQEKTDTINEGMKIDEVDEELGPKTAFGS